MPKYDRPTNIKLAIAMIKTAIRNTPRPGVK
jgi:hypothetical protein